MAEPLVAVVASLALVMGVESGRSKSWPPALHREQLLLLACCAGVVLYVLYLVVVGGDFMRGRMFTAPLLVLLCVLGMVLAVRGPALTPPVVLVVFALGFASLLVSNTTQFERRNVDSEIVNERAFYQWLWLAHRRGEASPPPQSTVEFPDRPDVLGGRLRAYAEAFGPITVRASATGQLAYYAGDRVRVIDQLGLSDAYIAREVPLPRNRPGHIVRYVSADYFRIRGDIALQPDWEARVRGLDPTLREDAAEGSDRIEMDGRGGRAAVPGDPPVGRGIACATRSAGGHAQVPDARCGASGAGRSAGAER